MNQDLRPHMARKRWRNALLMCLLCGLALDCTAGPRRAPAGWFHIIRLDAKTYAISEPRYWQQNVSYLILGEQQALLFDTGPGIYSIKRVVDSLTKLPALVVPSHLHFDHVGRIQEFKTIALLDTTELRSLVSKGLFVNPPLRHMLEKPTTFRISRWIKDGEFIDLGRRQVEMISTPGHTPDSVTLIDAAGKRAFTGDLMNRIVALYDVPGSDVRQAAASLRRILRTAPPGSLAYEAHAELPLQSAELEQFAAGLDAIVEGTAKSTAMCLGGQPMNSYAIGTFSAVLPTGTNATLKPLKTPLTTLDWQGDACAPAK